MADYTNPYLGQDNPYLTSKINAAQGDLIRNNNLVTQPAFNSAMVRSGSFGNSGVQQMNNNSNLNLDNALGRISTDMRGQDYQNQQQMYQWDQGFNRSLYNDAYGQNMNNLTTGVGLLGTLNGYHQQDLANGNAIRNTPLNYWSQFANQANGLGQGFGTQTNRTGTTSNPLISGLGGAQLGSAAMGWWNSQGNGGGGGSAPISQANQNNFDNFLQGSNYYGTGGG